MMVPRAYRYTSPTPGLPSKHNDKDIVAIQPAGRPPSPKPPRKTDVGRSTSMPSAFSPTPATPSKPVVIPTRTRDGGMRKSKGQDERTDKMPESVGNPHDPSLVPSSVSALLAMTSIPNPRQKPMPANQWIGSRRAGHGAREGAQKEYSRRSLSSSSPQTWDFLLSPPRDDELGSGSLESDTTLGPSSSVRSMSTESMPSLEADEESLCSASDPATPAFATRSSTNSDRRLKNLSASKGEDCISDHPLLPPTPAWEITMAEDANMELLRTDPKPLGRTRSSFKSNLTASFRAVRSAARSFSQYTTPTPRDDHLTRSLLSMTPHFTDERRPLPSTEPPHPALRRYLNPISLSPAELHFHNDPDQIAIQSSIQLQTYQRGLRPSENASSPPIFVSQNHSLSKNTPDIEGPLTSSLSPRQREPRENSDFLRVIVLEMNMRKRGKLSDISPGRARLWLPARQVGKTTTARGRENDEGQARDRIPRRWVGVNV